MVHASAVKLHRIPALATFCTGAAGKRPRSQICGSAVDMPTYSSYQDPDHTTARLPLRSLEERVSLQPDICSIGMSPAVTPLALARFNFSLLR
jgi:hypothetical protein